MKKPNSSLTIRHFRKNKKALIATRRLKEKSNMANNKRKMKYVNNKRLWWISSQICRSSCSQIQNNHRQQDQNQQKKLEKYIKSLIK